MKMNSNLHDDARSLRRKTGEASLLSFAKLYLSHHLTITPSNAHKEIYDLLAEMNSVRGKKAAIAAPRDFGKSTLITLISVIYSICYKKEEFIVIISNTASQAQKILENIRTELTENDALREDFPEIFESAGRPKPPRWRQHDIITRNKVEVLALGYTQPIRGRRHGAYRPSLVILDDIEPDEGWSTLEAAEKMKRWLNRSVLKVGNDKTNYLLIGTVHDSLSILGEYLSSDIHPNWMKKTYKALCTLPKHMSLWQRLWNIQNSKEVYKKKSGSSGALLFYDDHQEDMDEGAVLLWKEKWSLYQLMELYLENEYSFMSEFQNTPYDLSEFSFNVDEFDCWSDEYPSVDALLKVLGEGVYFVAACDPATGKSIVKGDYSAIVILACKDKSAYVIVADLARRSPDKLNKDIIAYAKRYPFSKLVIENNNFQELVVKALEKRALDKMVALNIERTTNTGNKVDRIMSIYEWVKNRTIKFSKADKLLLNEFRFFPQPNKDDDGLDALEMAFRFFKKSSNDHVKKMLDVVNDMSGEKNNLRNPKKIIGHIDPTTGEYRDFDNPFGMLSG